MDPAAVGEARGDAEDEVVEGAGVVDVDVVSEPNDTIEDSQTYAVMSMPAQNQRTVGHGLGGVHKSCGCRHTFKAGYGPSASLL